MVVHNKQNAANNFDNYQKNRKIVFLLQKFSGIIQKVFIFWSFRSFRKAHLIDFWHDKLCLINAGNWLRELKACSLGLNFETYILKILLWEFLALRSLWKGRDETSTAPLFQKVSTSVWLTLCSTTRGEPSLKRVSMRLFCNLVFLTLREQVSTLALISSLDIPLIFWSQRIKHRIYSKESNELLIDHLS